MTTLITCVVPVGPRQDHCRYLANCLESVKKQTVETNLVLVDDMHSIRAHCPTMTGYLQTEDSFIWTSPWRLGVAHAFNMGVALARTELCLLLGADDELDPRACERAIDFIRQEKPELAQRTYYALPVQYMHTEQIQFEPCGAAVVSKRLWNQTGGFPPESASGAPDAAFLSQIWNSDYFRIQGVGDMPLYYYRSHDLSDTAGRGPWQGVILATRDLLTQQFKQPEWGRYA